MNEDLKLMRFQRRCEIVRESIYFWAGSVPFCLRGFIVVVGWLEPRTLFLLSMLICAPCHPGEGGPGSGGIWQDDPK